MPAVTRAATRTRAPTLAPSATETATPLSPGLTFLTARPVTQTFPAGSTVSFVLQTDQGRQPVQFWVEGLPTGITARFNGSATPYMNLLLLDTSGLPAPRRYVIHPAAKLGQTQPVFAEITLNVTRCTEFQSGVFTQSIQSNLIQLTTAGKPSHEEGLLVPLQVCGSDRPRHLKVTLQAATSEAGTPMSAPPRFYVFRSLVWPAPERIETHDAHVANAEKLVNANGRELEHEIIPGLWLLVFERARFGSSQDPHDIPATVTYRLEILD